MLYGLDIGGTKIELAVFNKKLEKLHSERIPTPHQCYQDWLEAIVYLVRKADNQFGEIGTVGLGIPGFINQDTGVAGLANIRVADGQPIVQDLASLLKRPVRVENDANCFALSEAWDEENTQYENVLGLILGTGFGGGLVSKGKIYSGQSSMACELGHMQLNYHALQILGWDDAPIYHCGCGNKACLDNYLSGRGFEMLYRDIKGETLPAKQIIQNFYARDKDAVSFVNIFIEVLAASLGNIITAFAPNLVVFGGGLSNFDYLYEALPKILPPYLMRSATLPLIKKAKHGDSGGVRGAAALFLER